MTKQQFDNLNSSELIMPIYNKDRAFRIKSVNCRECLIELYEKRYFSDTMWYRYENCDIVTYCKVVDTETFEEKNMYTTHQKVAEFKKE